MATSLRGIDRETVGLVLDESLPLTELGNKKPTVKMSPSEIAFALLVDSFTVACEPLQNLVTSAVKTTHSDDWKNILCS